MSRGTGARGRVFKSATCQSGTSGGGVSDFDHFWASYPRRTAKLTAVKAYERARRLASADDIMAGVERYKQRKPEYADWCHPATWLNQGRWMDEPDLEPVKADIRGHVPPCKTNTDCLAKVFADAKKEREAS